MQSFWNGKRVLLTGHTGFKGSWLAQWLVSKGAAVHGLALEPETDPSLFELLGLRSALASHTIADMRDRSAVFGSVRNASPEIVFHLASQAIVRRGIAEPAETFSVNIMGTVNLYEALRDLCPGAVCVNVTSDKVYENDESGRPFAEDDPLGGHDPYSASKACVELISTAYRKTYEGTSPWLATARAGNVIGGGDWASDRLIPDLVRAVMNNEAPLLRNPSSTRPWQHVLDPLNGYLLIAERLSEVELDAAGAWNFGPEEGAVDDTVGALAQRFLNEVGAPLKWRMDSAQSPREKVNLRLDSTKARRVLNWRSMLAIEDAVNWTARWYRSWLAGEDVVAVTMEQLRQYERLGSGVSFPL